MTLLLSGQPEGGLLHALEQASGQNVYACYQCGKCTAGCPFSLQPQQVMRLLQLGQVEAALGHSTTWDCASCMTCATACPKGVSPAAVHRTLRTLHLQPVAGNGHGRLDRYYRAHVRKARTWLFANISRLSQVGSALAPVSNWALNLPGGKIVQHYLLGIHRARSLPPFARATFPAWFARRAPQAAGARGTVLLFHDTFMDFNYPSTGIAATELLEQAGFRVELADMVCCGRPMISKGLMDQVREKARINVERLYERAREGAWIIGCEPSCLLTLREEYPELLHGTDLQDRAQVVARQTLLIDEFLGMLDDRGELGLTFDTAAARDLDVVFHGHCHQKASASPERSVQLLRKAGYRADMASASCCGMAGAYGYEKEHYAASQAAGERALFPIIRERPGAQVAVMGTSCRQQVEHFTGRRARHVVELLREALK